MAIDWERVVIVSDEDTVNVIAGKTVLYLLNGGSAVAGMTEWGDINGTLSDQTDLQNALNAKATTANLGALAFEDDTPNDGKTYGRRNKHWYEVGSGAWGSITGNIQSQTDLQEALGEKLDDAPSNNVIYGRKNGAWTEVSVGGGGSATWGDITGAISDQTDLQTALNAKANTADLGTLATKNDVSVDGNSYIRKNGQWTRLENATLEIRKIYPFAKGSPAVLSVNENLVSMECSFGIKQTGSGTPSASNIRPFSGFNRIRIQEYDGETSVLNVGVGLNTTVYGGYWWTDKDDFIVPYGHIASYAGEGLVGRWWSDRDVQDGSNSPTIGAEVVYELATPQTIQIGIIEWPTTTGVRTVYIRRNWDSDMTAEDQLIASVLDSSDLAGVIGQQIAPTFDPTETYAIDDYVIYNYGLFRFIAPHSGTWDESHVTQTTVMAELVRRTS